MKGPLISVVLPFYNARDNLEEAVNSILEQDYRNLELVLVNDASTDRSPSIAEDLRKNDSRIRIISHQTNQGAGPGRNTGVSHSRGEYIFFLDSDDFLKAGALRILLETALREHVGVVIGSCEQLDSEGIISDHDRNMDFGEPPAFGVIDGDEAVRRWLGINGTFLPVRPWGILIDSALYRSSGLTFSPGEHEDLSLTPFLYRFAERVVYLEEIVLTYRIRPGSIINSPQSLERIHRYDRVWDDTSSRIDYFGLQRYRREFKAFHIGNLIWMLSKGPCSRDILEAAGRLMKEKMRMSIEPQLVDDRRNLAYLLENAARMLESSGEEKSFSLWRDIVFAVGDDILCRFIRKRFIEIRNMIWRFQMNDKNTKEEVLRIEKQLSGTGTDDCDRPDELSDLKLENERLRKRLVEVSFYLNELLTAMERRAEVSEGRILRRNRFGRQGLQPPSVYQVFTRLPIIRSFREARAISKIRESGHFSSEFYREAYKDLSEYQGDLLLHFVRYGGYEGRSPNRYFDSKWYLNSNPGVAKKGINPLYHYLVIGSDEGLWPSPDYSPWEYADLMAENK